MTIKAIIDADGVVTNVIILDPSAEADWLAAGGLGDGEAVIECPEDVGVGWTHTGSDWEPPAVPPPEPPSKTDLKAHAASARYAKETGGIVFAGSPIATDRESQNLINGAYNLALANPATIIKFKSPAGFVELDAATMIAIALAAAEHVQACFAKEADIVAAIEADEITTTAEIDAAFAAL